MGEQSVRARNAGRNVSRSEQLGVRIGAEPQLLVYTDSNEVYDASAPGDITLRFVNNGVSGIKFLTVTLQDTKKLKVLSAPTQYIGAIDSDDYQTATFTVRLTGAATEIELPVLVNYQDPNNRKYEQGLTVIVPIHSKQELGTQGGNGWVLIVVVIIVVVAGFVMYRRMHKRRTARHR